MDAYVGGDVGVEFLENCTCSICTEGIFFCKQSLIHQIHNIYSKKPIECSYSVLDEYAKNIVKKFGLDNGGHKRTPVATHFKLTKDESGISIDQSMYRSMIGSLLYLTASRPDITFDVGVCARYQAEQKMSNLTQVKRILKYINNISDYEILYSYSEDSKLMGYCDADWAGSADDRKSTSEGCFFLGNNLIS